MADGTAVFASFSFCLPGFLFRYFSLFISRLFALFFLLFPLFQLCLSLSSSLDIISCCYVNIYIYISVPVYSVYKRDIATGPGVLEGPVRTRFFKIASAGKACEEWLGGASIALLYCLARA